MQLSGVKMETLLEPSGRVEEALVHFLNKMIEALPHRRSNRKAAVALIVGEATYVCKVCGFGRLSKDKAELNREITDHESSTAHTLTMRRVTLEGNYALFKAIESADFLSAVLMPQGLEESHLVNSETAEAYKELLYNFEQRRNGLFCCKTCPSMGLLSSQNMNEHVNGRAHLERKQNRQQPSSSQQPQFPTTTPSRYDQSETVRRLFDLQQPMMGQAKGGDYDIDLSLKKRPIRASTTVSDDNGNIFETALPNKRLIKCLICNLQIMASNDSEEAILEVKWLHQMTEEHSNNAKKHKKLPVQLPPIVDLTGAQSPQQAPISANLQPGYAPTNVGVSNYQFQIPVQPEPPGVSHASGQPSSSSNLTPAPIVLKGLPSECSHEEIIRAVRNVGYEDVLFKVGLAIVDEKPGTCCFLQFGVNGASRVEEFRRRRSLSLPGGCKAPIADEKEMYVAGRLIVDKGKTASYAYSEVTRDLHTGQWSTQKDPSKEVTPVLFMRGLPPNSTERETIEALTSMGYGNVLIGVSHTKGKDGVEKNFGFVELRDDACATALLSQGAFPMKGMTVSLHTSGKKNLSGQFTIAKPPSLSVPSYTQSQQLPTSFGGGTNVANGVQSSLPVQQLQTQLNITPVLFLGKLPLDGTQKETETKVLKVLAEIGFGIGLVAVTVVKEGDSKCFGFLQYKDVQHAWPLLQMGTFKMGDNQVVVGTTNKTRLTNYTPAPQSFEEQLPNLWARIDPVTQQNLTPVLYLRNLSADSTEEQLIDTLTKLGFDRGLVAVAKPKETSGNPTTYAFVQYQDKWHTLPLLVAGSFPLGGRQVAITTTNKESLNRRTLVSERGGRDLNTADGMETGVLLTSIKPAAAKAMTKTSLESLPPPSLPDWTTSHEATHMYQNQSYTSGPMVSTAPTPFCGPGPGFSSPPSAGADPTVLQQMMLQVDTAVPGVTSWLEWLGMERHLWFFHKLDWMGILRLGVDTLQARGIPSSDAQVLHKAIQRLEDRVPQIRHWIDLVDRSANGVSELLDSYFVDELLRSPIPKYTAELHRLQQESLHELDGDIRATEVDKLSRQNITGHVTCLMLCVMRRLRKPNQMALMSVTDVDRILAYLKKFVKHSAFNERQATCFLDRATDLNVEVFNRRELQQRAQKFMEQKIQKRQDLQELEQNEEQQPPPVVEPTEPPSVNVYERRRRKEHPPVQNDRKRPPIEVDLTRDSPQPRDSKAQRIEKTLENKSALLTDSTSGTMDSVMDEARQILNAARQKDTNYGYTTDYQSLPSAETASAEPQMKFSDERSNLGALQMFQGGSSSGWNLEQPLNQQRGEETSLDREERVRRMLFGGNIPANSDFSARLQQHLLATLEEKEKSKPTARAEASPRQRKSGRSWKDQLQDVIAESGAADNQPSTSSRFQQATDVVSIPSADQTSSGGDVDMWTSLRSSGLMSMVEGGMQPDRGRTLGLLEQYLTSKISDSRSEAALASTKERTLTEDAVHEQACQSFLDQVNARDHSTSVQNMDDLNLIAVNNEATIKAYLDQLKEIDQRENTAKNRREEQNEIVMDVRRAATMLDELQQEGHLFKGYLGTYYESNQTDSHKPVSSSWHQHDYERQTEFHPQEETQWHRSPTTVTDSGDFGELWSASEHRSPALSSLQRALDASGDSTLVALSAQMFGESLRLNSREASEMLEQLSLKWESLTSAEERNEFMLWLALKLRNSF